jgi:hypothetical protein
MAAYKFTIRTTLALYPEISVLEDPEPKMFLFRYNRKNLRRSIRKSKLPAQNDPLILPGNLLISYLRGNYGQLPVTFIVSHSQPKIFIINIE